MRTFSLIAAFASTVPAANWLIGNAGTECIPHGPCLIPVGFGLHAPSGVLMIGAALVLRDMVHEAGGIRAALIAIAIGAFVFFTFVVVASVISSYTSTAYHTCLYIWARDVEKAQTAGQAIQVAAPAPLAAVLG